MVLVHLFQPQVLAEFYVYLPPVMLPVFQTLYHDLSMQVPVPVQYHFYFNGRVIQRNL